jgi:hypothetical protein
LAQTIFPLTPVDVSPGATGAWTDVDVSANVPVGATGVILLMVNTRGFADDIGARKNGSTDDRHDSFTGHVGAGVGIDANRKFEAYIGTALDIIYLIGYTMTGVTFFTNGVDKSLGGAGAWTDIDCSAEAPSAIGLIFENTAPAPIMD